MTSTCRTTKRGAGRLSLLALAGMGLSLALSPARARAASFTWNGSRSGDWFDTRNWTPAGVPGINDIANVAGGRTIALAGRDVSVGGLNLSGTAIDNGTLRTLTGMTWSGGTVSCTLIASQRLDITGSADKSIADGDSVVNAGAATWSTPSDGSGRILLGTNSRFVNQASATFATASDGTVFLITPGKTGGNIDNAGIMAKVAGSGTTRAIGSTLVSLNEEGTLRCDVGTFLIDGILNLNQPNVIGGGSLVRLGGTINLNRLTTLYNTVEMVGGTLNGDPLGSLAGGGAPLLRWTGGSLSGTINITPSLPVEVSGPNSKYLLADCALNNNSAFYWSTPYEGAGRILLRRRARFNNGAGAAFNATTDGTVFGFDDIGSDADRAILVNQGLFSKTAGTGSTTFSGNAYADFSNAGTINASSGSLAFNTRLDLNANSVLSGPGLLKMGAGNTFVNAPTSLNTTFEVDGGTLTGGAGGSLGNGGGLLRWANGLVAGTLNTGAGLNFEISGLADKSVLAAAVINNGGNAVWSSPADGAGRILMARNSSFNTLASGGFTALSSGSVFRFSEDNLPAASYAATVGNSGQWSLAPGGGSRRIEGNIVFSNNGALNLNTGLLSVPSFINGASGAVNISLAGNAPGSTQGALVVGATATLGGSLNLTPAAGFAPLTGSVLNVLSFGALQNTFAAINGLDLGLGRSLTPSYSANALSLTAQARPVVISLSATSGFVGDTLTINGLNLSDVSSVTFLGAGTGVPATIGARTATSLQIVVPLGARSGAITVLNSGGVANNLSFKVLPRLLSLSTRSGLSGTVVTLTGTGFNAGSNPIVRFNGVPAVVTSISPGGDIVQVVVPATASTGLVSISTGVGTASSPYIFTVPPQILSFSPLSASPGSVVTISGRGLIGVRAVYFGLSRALYSVISPTLVRAFVPAGARSGIITILTASNRAQSTTRFLIAPKLLAFSPASGVAGSLVTITGVGLTEVTSVRLGDVPMIFSRLSDTTLRATVPANAVSARLSVTSAGGTSSSLGLFTLLPSIRSFSPSSGPVGTTVTIQGSGLAGARSASINGSPAVLTRLSATAVSIVIPAGATSGQVVITTGAGTATSAASFTVVSTPGA